MFSKWGKSKSSKEVKKKSNAESIITSLHKITMPGTHWRQHGNSTLKTKCKSKSRKHSRSPSPSKKVACCHSYDEGQPAQSPPHPSSSFTKSCHIDPRNSVLSEPSLDRGPKISLERCPKISLERGQSLKKTGLLSAVIGEGFMGTTSYSSDIYDPYGSPLVSPRATDYENGIAYEANSPVLKQRGVNAILQPKNYMARPISLKLNAPDSLMLSPSASPTRVFGHDPVANNGFQLGSRQCLNPGSTNNSGNNSFTGDKPCKLFIPQNRLSPEGSPLTSPRMRIQSGSVSPSHPRSGPLSAESPTGWPDAGRKQSYPLPLPPVQISISAPFTPSFSPVTSPRIPRSPTRIDNPPSPTSHWKKGRLLGRGTFGHVYLGFNSESGEMCAMKEVTLFSDDAKSKESAQQLRKEISLLSRLRHKNIVQYFGSEMVDDKLYIYLEYVSGGSIHRILQEYGHLGEAAIRSYTQQILSGLAYLHATNTLHRDIKGANILVDPNGRVRLADFGMAKHISGNSMPLSFKGSPYWMAPEVITNSRGCNLAVDIWSLGCTVLEMATTKPPWSQYEGVAAMFKVGNSKELPDIPNHLSEEGKDFVLKCLQRNPSHRPTAVELLDHPFVRNASITERPVSSAEPVESTPALAYAANALSNRIPKNDTNLVKNISCPVSPSRNSPQSTRGRLSLSHTPSPRAVSGALSPPGKYPNALKGVLQKARSSVATFSRENDYLGNNTNQPLSSREQLYDSHFVLAGRVSQHLLGSPVR